MQIKKTETFIEHDLIIADTKVGTVELCPERNEIARLIIFKPYQNKGYGTLFVKELVAQGYKSLWVRSDNPRAIHVYEKCGFKKGKTHMFEMTFGSEDKVESKTPDIIDKLRTEIKALTDGVEPERIWNADVLAIIDKYKVESEE